MVPFLWSEHLRTSGSASILVEWRWARASKYAKMFVLSNGIFANIHHLSDNCVVSQFQFHSRLCRFKWFQTHSAHLAGTFVGNFANKYFCGRRSNRILAIPLRANVRSDRGGRAIVAFENGFAFPGLASFAVASHLHHMWRIFAPVPGHSRYKDAHLKKHVNHGLWHHHDISHTHVLFPRDFLHSIAELHAQNVRQIHWSAHIDDCECNYVR